MMQIILSSEFVRNSMICTINKYAKLASLLNSIWTNNVLVPLVELIKAVYLGHYREYYGGQYFTESDLVVLEKAFIYWA